MLAFSNADDINPKGVVFKHFKISSMMFLLGLLTLRSEVAVAVTGGEIHGNVCGEISTDQTLRWQVLPFLLVNSH